MAKAKYKRRYIGNKRWRNEHLLVAEKVLGRHLPKSVEIHHIDGNGFNNKHNNLVICPSKAYHMLLHQRERALLASGNASWLKCRLCGKYDAPVNLAICKVDIGHTLHTNIHHRACDAEYARARRRGQK